MGHMQTHRPCAAARKAVVARSQPKANPTPTANKLDALRAAQEQSEKAVLKIKEEELRAYRRDTEARLQALETIATLGEGRIRVDYKDVPEDDDEARKRGG